MAGKRIRIDLEDKDGAKYKFNLEGNINRDKVLKIFDLLDLMNIEETTDNPGVESVGGKIWHIVDKYYPTGKFTSSDILEKYEDEYNQPIKLSVVVLPVNFTESPLFAPVTDVFCTKPFSAALEEAAVSSSGAASNVNLPDP